MAFEALARARELDGCQNRVGLLWAKTAVHRARQLQADPHGDLPVVLEMCSRAEDIEPWRRVRDRALELSRAFGRGAQL